MLQENFPCMCARILCLRHSLLLMLHREVLKEASKALLRFICVLRDICKMYSKACCVKKQSFVTQIMLGKGIKVYFVTISNVYNMEQAKQVEQFCLCPFYLPAMGKHLPVWHRAKHIYKKNAGESPQIPEAVNYFPLPYLYHPLPIFKTIQMHFFF